MPVGVLLVAGFVILSVLFLLAPRVVNQQKPPNYAGCYEAAGAPKIEIARDSLRIAQQPALSMPYKVEYIKGWALSLDSSLDLVVRGSAVTIASRPGHGQNVFFIREGEWAPSNPGFTLDDETGQYSVRYTRTGARCIV